MSNVIWLANQHRTRPELGRKKLGGRDITGWLAVDKPPDISSAQVVNAARKAFSARKAGHAGTLDVPATGVLAIAFGEATKTIPFVTNSRKCYRFSVRFGQATETDDATGSIIAESGLRPTDEEICNALVGFRGDILQVPPRFSSVKVQGKRAYQRSLNGDKLELAARPLTMYEINLTGRPDEDHAEFKMTCGKGGYVRSVARDLGKILGCFGHVTQLRRIWSGPFDVDACISFDLLETLDAEPLDSYLKPLQTGLSGLPELRCTLAEANRIRTGRPGKVFGEMLDYGETAWVSCKGTAVGIGTYRGGELHPDRVFNWPDQVVL